MEKQKKNRKQIVFEIPHELHTEVKVWAARRNISMCDWFTRAIVERLKKENRDESERM